MERYTLLTTCCSSLDLAPPTADPHLVRDSPFELTFRIVAAPCLPKEKRGGSACYCVPSRGVIAAIPAYSATTTAYPSAALLACCAEVIDALLRV